MATSSEELSRVCIGCEKTLPRNQYSKNQWKKGLDGKCSTCVNGNTSSTVKTSKQSTDEQNASQVTTTSGDENQETPVAPLPSPNNNNNDKGDGEMLFEDASGEEVDEEEFLDARSSDDEDDNVTATGVEASNANGHSPSTVENGNDKQILLETAKPNTDSKQEAKMTVSETVVNSGDSIAVDAEEVERDEVEEPEKEEKHETEDELIQEEDQPIQLEEEPDIVSSNDNNDTNRQSQQRLLERIHAQQHEQPVSTPQPQQPATPSINRRSTAPRSIVNSIVIRQTEETLQALQSNLAYSSAELLRTLERHLSSLNGSSRRPVGGISLPASAVAWLVSQKETNDSLRSLEHLLPKLTHLRLTNAKWPTKPKSTSNSNSIHNAAAPPQPQEMSLEYYNQALSYFHQLRYNPQVDIGIFPNLQVLLLDSVPPDWIVRLPFLASSLQVLRVEHACLKDLESLLLLGGHDDSDNNDTNNDDTTDDVEYSQLTHLKLSHCQLGETTTGLTPTPSLSQQDSTDTTENLPLARMPSLLSLSLSHNHIRSEGTVLASGISHATRLSTLDLSHNQIPSMLQAPTYLGNLQTLILTGNHLKSAKGIDRLYSLQTVALDYNGIASWMDVAGLGRLPELKVLKLKGNPFMETDPKRKHARVMLLDIFRDQRWASLTTSTAAVAVAATNDDSNHNSNTTVPTFRHLEAVLPIIDDKPASSRELKALQQRAFMIVSSPTTNSRSAAPMQQQRQTNSAATTTTAGELPSGSDSRLEQDKAMVADGAESKGLSQVKRRKLMSKRRKASRAVIADDLDTRTMPISSANQQHSIINGVPIVVVSDEKKEEEKVQDESRPSVKESDKANGSSPKLSFSITDIISSLDVQSNNSNGTRSKKTDDGGQGKLDPSRKGNDSQVEAMSTETSGKSQLHCNNSGTGQNPLTTVDFEWPEPLPYVPKDNLYGEFEWKTETTISLRNGKSRKPKQKGKKDRHSNQKASPTRKTTNKAANMSSSKKKAAKGADRNNPGGGMQAAAAAASLKEKKIGSGRPGSKPASKNDGEEDIIDHASATAVETAESTVASDAVALDEKPSANSNPKGGSMRRSYTLRSVSSDEGNANELISPNSITGAAFPAMAMDAGGDDATCSSMGTNRSGATSRSLRGPNQLDKFHLAEIKSKFLGMEQERELLCAENLELYFKTFVFPDFVPNIDSDQLNADVDTWQSVFFRYPRIQMLPKDRQLRDNIAKGTPAQLQTNRMGENDREQCVKVWREDVVACGKPALRRLKPNRTAHFGFHGDLTWQEGKVKTVSECRQVILCVSTTSFYVILDNDKLTAKEEPSPANNTGLQNATDMSPMTKSRPKSRKFPSPLPSDAVFGQALWPHAVACHPLNDILGITIGFGFQRMTLRVRNSAYPSAVGYTYTLLTSNKMRTVELLREFQSLAKEATLEMGRALTEDAVKIDNDDRVFLDALAAAVAPEPLGAVLHYQILKQRWKHGQRGAVSRILVVTDSKIYLLDEDYVGDGSISVDADSGRRLGTPTLKMIDSADLQLISEVRAADADPNATTIVIRPSQNFSRTKRWRLLCRDRSGAEKLVEDVRKGMSLVE